MAGLEARQILSTFKLIIDCHMMKRTLLCLLLTCFVAYSQAQTVNLSSSNLPIISINTNGQNIVNEPKITADMGIIFNGAGLRNNMTDPFNHYNGKIGIEIRGQSSQGFPMKSYTIELRDAAGLDNEQPLFGLPKEADWVLYAPFTDKTLMRNYLAYAISRSLGNWAANTRFVELIVNGDYKGVYVFMEKIERSTGRLGLAKLALTDVSGDAVTGGYIFSLDKQPNGWFSKYPAPNANNSNTRQFSYVYPKPEDIVQPQKDYIKSYVDGFEDALFGAQFQDPFNGVRKYADLTSFIDYFIVNEIGRNVDGYRLSSYFHKDRDSKRTKIYAGPVWDYDLAFRNADYCNGSYTTGWAYQFNYVCPGDGAGLIPFWWNRFMEDTAFVRDLRCRWKEKRQTVLSESRLFFLIDSAATVLNEAQQRHFTKWNILGQYVWPNPQPIASNYNQEISYLKSWLSARLTWIDENIPNKGTCSDYPSDRVESVLISIAPNPVNGNAVIKIQSKIAQEIHWQVIDVSGRIVSARKGLLKSGANSFSLGAGGWASGVYAIRFQTGNGERYVYRVVR